MVYTWHQCIMLISEKRNVEAKSSGKKKFTCTVSGFGFRVSDVGCRV